MANYATKAIWAMLGRGESYLAPAPLEVAGLKPTDRPRLECCEDDVK